VYFVVCLTNQRGSRIEQVAVTSDEQPLIDLNWTFLCPQRFINLVLPTTLPAMGVLLLLSLLLFVPLLFFLGMQDLVI
jgi:hypothetical protein